jgi:hypothetical protein
MLINDGIYYASGVHVLYNRNTNKLYLMDDTGTTYMGGYTPGSANVISNSQCELDCSLTTVSAVGSVLTVNWCLEFLPSMAGRSCYGWLTCRDQADLADGWNRYGKYYVPAPPVNGAIVPGGGNIQTGVPVTISSLHTDPNGCLNVRRGLVLINTSFKSKNAVYLKYDSFKNLIYLRNDADSSFGTGFEPGSANILSNSQCRVYCAGSSVSFVGDTMQVNWQVEFLYPVGTVLGSWIDTLDWDGLRDPWDFRNTYNLVP